MSRTQWVWLVATLLYAIFFSWYTSFGGPLKPAEIDRYMARMESRVPAPAAERLASIRQFMEQDTGDDFVMLNAIELYEIPLQVEGVEPGETTSQVLDKYMAYMAPALIARASHPVLFGQAAGSAMDLINADGMDRWTTGAGMRYRSRRDLFDIATHSDFASSHEYKIAAMQKTIAFPIDPWFQLGDPRLVFGLMLALMATGLSWREASGGQARP